MLYFDSKMDDGVFLRLVKNMPKKSFLVLEDMDYLFEDRKAHDTQKNNITISSILNILDGVATRDGFVCFLSTNHKQHLDQALIRPGRVDRVVHFETLKKEEANQMYKNFMEL